jgi:ribose transport system ATP-binding protein
MAPTPVPSAPLLAVRGLTKQYPGVRALDGVDFDVFAGEVHCLVGQNGAGKSTLIKCVSGLVAPTDGEVLFDGEPLPVGNTTASLTRGIATIYQELDLVVDLTVAESVFLGHAPRRGPLLDHRTMNRRTDELLALLGREGTIKPTAYVRDLRPAGQQVVSIIRALSQDARLVIMDEPSAVLDENEVEGLFDVVRRLREHRVGIVYITHRLAEVKTIGDRITVLRDGRTVADGLPAATTSTGQVVNLMVGRNLEQVFPDRAESVEEVVLSVRGLTRAPDVADVSFDVRAGEVLGIAGLVGAGRTELLRAIYGLERPDTGEIRVDGRPLPLGRTTEAVKRGIGLAPEDRKSQGLLLGWTLTKNVTLADLARFSRFFLLDAGEERRETERHLTSLGTEPRNPDRITRELSGGNQQKVVLARWLLRSCRVLLLDEPTRGVDVAAKAETYGLIRRLASTGIAVIMVSSEWEELVGLCDRILVMRDGGLVEELAGETATEEAILHACLHDPEEAEARLVEAPS